MLHILTILALFIVGFWLWFGLSRNKIIANSQDTNSHQEGVSIIIAYKDECENIGLLVESILRQNYPTFEIIATDDFSKDDGPAILAAITDPKLVNIKATEDNPGKKVALAQGVAIAKYPFLLFTDGDCVASSEEWISSMMAARKTDTDVVCGYAPHTVQRGWLGIWQQFETWMTAIQYFTYAISGLPYMAVGRNMLVKKSSFDKVGGYSSHTDISSGDDDLLVQSIGTTGIITPCIDRKSWMISPAKSTLKAYLLQKTRHVGTSVKYQWKHQFLLSLFAGLQFMFWTLVIVTLAFQPMMWRECFIIIVLKWSSQMICHHQWAKSLAATKIQWYFPTLDMMTPIYYAVLVIGLVLRRRSW